MNPESTNQTGESAKPTLVFSVDVEDWGQSVLDQRLPISDYCADNVQRLLDLLARADGARGTFFVLGKLAERHPNVVRAIQRAGHEVACHGYGHVPIHRQTRNEFRNDIRRAVGVLADAIGTQLKGFRAPVFSIRRDTLWALDELADAGFEYDSSVFPFDGPRYGIGDWPTVPRRVRVCKGNSIVEYPLTVMNVGGRRAPISGGGYARLLPSRLLVRLLDREARQRHTPPVFYCHPYEADTDELRRRYPIPPWGSQRVAWSLRLHQGLGRRGFAAKLARIVEHFKLVSFAQAIESAGSISDYVVETGDRRTNATTATPTATRIADRGRQPAGATPIESI